MSMKNVNKKRQGEEFYDMKLGLYDWAENADDYKLVVDLMPKSKTTADLIETLDEINQLLPQDTKFIFDGTISSLKYLVENKLMSLKKIKNPLLREAIFKHLYRPSQTKNINVSLNRWSGQALRCKAVTIGLYFKNKKLVFLRGLETAEHLRYLSEWDFPVFDDDIEKGRISQKSYIRLLALNTIWVTLMGIAPWNKTKVRNTGEFILKNIIASYTKGTMLYAVFERLQPYIDLIAKKYFPEFHTKDHRACVAVRHAAIIVLYRLIDYLPKNAQPHPTFRVDGFLNKFIEYIFAPNFRPQKWFLKYLNSEMEKRIRFIKVLGDEGVITPLIKEKKAIRYIPVFESFRFIPKKEIPTLPIELVRVFRNKNFPLKDKDEIARNIIFNIQKLVTFKGEINQYESSMRESLYMCIFSVLEPLRKAIWKREITHHPRFTESNEILEDLSQDITTETLSAILKYDVSKNPSFFGYIKKVLPLTIHSKVRKKKIETLTIPLEKEEDIVGENIEEIIANREIKEKLRNIIETLPKKEKEAIRKSYFNAEKLTEAERKARYRGLQKLKLSPELKKFFK